MTKDELLNYIENETNFKKLINDNSVFRIELTEDIIPILAELVVDQKIYTSTHAIDGKISIYMELTNIKNKDRYYNIQRWEYLREGYGMIDNDPLSLQLMDKIIEILKGKS